MENSCLNCGNPHTGKFCSHCGQKARVHRVTFASIMHDVPHSFLHIDKGFFYTLKQLALRPGKTIREYLEGKRVNHFSAISYLLLLCTVSSFLSHSLFVHRDNKHEAMLFPSVVEFFYKYPSLMFASMIPFISVWSWLFNKRTGYNYWENIILNTYLIAQFNIVVVAAMLYIVATHKMIGNFTPVLTIFFIYFIFAYGQFFGRPRSFSAIAARFMMYIMVIITILTGLTAAGFMTPWWNF